MAERTDELDKQINFSDTTNIKMDSKTVFEECENGNLGYIFQFLRTSGANINMQNEWTKDTLLHVCARNGNDSIATKVLEHPSVDADYLRRRNLSGDTCLHVAAQFGNHKILAQILAHEFSVDVINMPNDYTMDIPLHFAVKYGHLKCIEVLLRNNSDVLVLNNDYRIPLQYASTSSCRIDIIDMFLRFSSHASSTGYSLSETLVCYAIKGVGPGTLSDLLRKHSPGVKQNPRVTVGLQLAIEHNDFEITTYLLKCGASVNEKTSGNFTSLHAAAKSNSIEMFDTIFPLCDDVNVVSEEGTALYIAAGMGNEAIVRILINAGADLESNMFMETALHRAARIGSKECIALLTRGGADNMKEISRDGTALDIFFARDRETAVAWLSESLDLFRFHSFRRAAIHVMHKWKPARLEYFDYDGVMSTDNLESFINEYKDDFIVFLHVLTKMKCFETSVRIIRFWRRCKFQEKQFRLTPQTENLLAKAIKHPDENLINFLLTFPNFISYTSSPGALSEGEKALHAAVETNRIEWVKVLLDAEIKPRDLPGVYVANRKCDKVNRYLIENVEIVTEQTISPYKIPLVQYAIIHRNFHIGACLMQKGASCIGRDEFHFTALHDAVWTRDVPTAEVLRYPEIINAQISMPSNDVYGLDGSTPLHLAARAIHPEMVGALLQEGARVKIYDNRGRLPLDLAFIQNDFQSIATLISAGADIQDLTENELRLEQEDEDTSVLEVLKRCGFDKFSLFLSEDNPENEEFLKRDPLTLQDICGRVIRRSLQPNAWVGVEKLPLPDLMKDFITLELKLYDYGGYETESNYFYPTSCRLDCHKQVDSDDEAIDDPILQLPYEL